MNARCSTAFAVCAITPKPLRVRLGRGWPKRLDVGFGRDGVHARLLLAEHNGEVDLRITGASADAVMKMDAVIRSGFNRRFELVLREVR